jgi:hypothetical protein
MGVLSCVPLVQFALKIRAVETLMTHSEFVESANFFFSDITSTRFGNCFQCVLFYINKSSQPGLEGIPVKAFRRVFPSSVHHPSGTPSGRRTIHSLQLSVARHALKYFDLDATKVCSLWEDYRCISVQGITKQCLSSDFVYFYISGETSIFTTK